MIDLHIHSKYSDGSDSVREILKKAEALKLELISITDHNSVDANVEIANDSDLRKVFSGKIIPGCEVLATYKGEFVEVLGYMKDFKNFGSTLVSPFGIESTILEKYILVSKHMGLKIDADVMRRELNEKEYSAMAIFVQALASNPEYARAFSLGDNPCARFHDNFYSNPTTPFYINEKYFYKSVREVIRDIHNASGVAFLAHPFQYPHSDQKDFIEELISNNPFDGIECLYPTFEKGQRDYLKFLCRMYGLMISGGSDYHGINRPSNNMGTGINDNLDIPYEIVSYWSKPLERVLVNRRYF